MFKLKAERGFTLIELLVVIAIIGVLASVVLASLNSARVKARDAKRVSDMKQLQLALTLYYDSNSGQYPANVTGELVSNLSVLVPTYLPSLPSDPTNVGSNNYRYRTNGTRTGYTLMLHFEGNPSPAVWCKYNVDGGDGGWSATASYYLVGSPECPGK